MNISASHGWFLKSKCLYMFVCGVSGSSLFCKPVSAIESKCLYMFVVVYLGHQLFCKPVSADVYHVMGRVTR